MPKQDDAFGEVEDSPEVKAKKIALRVDELDNNYRRDQRKKDAILPFEIWGERFKMLGNIFGRFTELGKLVGEVVVNWGLLIAWGWYSFSTLDADNSMEIVKIPLSLPFIKLALDSANKTWNMSKSDNATDE